MSAAIDTALPPPTAGASQTTLYNGPSTILKPRPDVIRDFLDYWFEFAEGSIEIAWRDPTDKKIKHARHFNIRDSALEEFACQINSIEGQDVYFTPAIVSNSVGRASDKDFVCSAGFWVDQDDLADINYADSLPHEFCPTSYVFTGRTPEPRRQMWFRLDQPTYDPHIVRETNSKLVNFYKGDPSVVNPSRLMRLPGCISFPWKPGRTPELVSWEHPSDGRRRSHPIVLAATLPDLKPQLIEQPASGTKSNAATVSQLIERIKAGEYWHNNLVKLIAHWIGRGMSDQEMLIWAPEFTHEGYEVSQTEEEIQAAIDGARFKWSAPNVDRPATTRLEEAQAVFADAVALPTQPEDDWVPIGRAAADIQPDTTPHLCRDVIKTGMTGVMHAAHYTGKTILAAELACSLAWGLPFLGHRTKQGNVYIVELEGSSLLADNIRAWHIRRDLKISPNIIIADEPFALFDDVSITRLRRDLRYFNRNLSGGISLVILDTYSQLIAGEDENSTAIGASAAKTLKAACNEIAATGLIIHHSNTTGELRGAKSLINNLDFEIHPEKTKDNSTIKITYVKFKGGQTAPPDYFRIERQDLPGYFDEDGNQLNAGVVVQVDSAEAATLANAQGNKLKNQNAREIAYRAITDNALNGRISRSKALNEFNMEYSGGAFRTKAKAEGKPKSNEDDGTIPKSRRTVFNRALRELVKNKLIETEGKWIQIIPASPAEIFPSASSARQAIH